MAEESRGSFWTRIKLIWNDRVMQVKGKVDEVKEKTYE